MGTGDAGASLVRVNKQELVIPVEDGAGRGSGDVICVENVAEDDIAFKMKTTNPNRYIVRPNVSCIPKGESCNIRVMLAENAPQPEPGPSKDRFQLRVCLAPGLSEDLAPAEFWNENEDRADLARLKFTVKFVPFHLPEPEPAPEAKKPEVKNMPEAEALLADGKQGEAVEKVAELEQSLQDRDSELAKIRTELKETIEAKDRTLRQVPNTPMNANKAFWDAYGGLGVVAIALVVVVAVFSVMFNRVR